MADWNELRARLSHDLVKNRLIPATSRIIKIVNGSVVADPVETFDTTITTVWAGTSPSLKLLFESCESALSPRNFFSVEPLIHCPPSTIEWLPDLIHELWLERHNVRDWCRSGCELASGVDTAIRGAGELLSNCYHAEEHKADILDALFRLQKASTGLSTHLSLIENRFLL
jgi:hypothetical protein